MREIFQVYLSYSTMLPLEHSEWTLNIIWFPIDWRFDFNKVVEFNAHHGERDPHKNIFTNFSYYAISATF